MEHIHGAAHYYYAGPQIPAAQVPHAHFRPGSINMVPVPGTSTRPVAVEEYKYRVKIIPKQKKEFRVISWHGVHEKFKSPTELKMKLISTLSDHVPPASKIDTFEIGYLEGRRQTKRWIISEEDVTEMYANGPNDEHEILLWCDGKDVSCKRKAPEDDATIGEKPTPKRSTHEDEVEELAKELTDTHGDNYTYAQYKLWARMIVDKQHADKNTPPNIPMITGKTEKRGKKDFSESLANCAVAIVKALQTPAVPSAPATSTPGHASLALPDGISPGKKVNLRSQYLSQIKTLQSLRDDNVLTQEEFQVEKQMVLDSLKALK